MERGHAVSLGSAGKTVNRRLLQWFNGCGSLKTTGAKNVPSDPGTKGLWVKEVTMYIH